MADPFIAEIRIVPFNFAPRGWAFCDGQLLPIAQNTALFSLVGTTYGGDGRTTFGLPNLQGRLPMHSGQGPGLSLRDLGETGGSETVTLLESEIPSHIHGLFPGSSGPTAEPEGSAFGLSPSRPYAAGTVPSAPMAALSSAGGNQPHNNLSPYLVLHFIIALQGVFPPRS